jgi:hypothetical protein
MSSTANGTLGVTRSGDHFVDEYGDLWFIVADDMRGNCAVDREDGYRAGMVSRGTVFARCDGDTFDVNNPAEFVVDNNRWTRND